MRSLMVVCALAGAGTAAGATDYHVSPRGDDGNPGTRQRPWRTIARVNQQTLEPGDRVLFEGGESFAGTIRLEPEDSGEPEARVVISSYGEARATIDAGDGAGLVAREVDYLTVRELRFVGSGRLEGNTENGIRAVRGEGLEVDRVEVSGFRETGVLVHGVRRARITRVHAHDNGQAGIASCMGGPGTPMSEDLYIGHCVAENNPGNPANLTNHSGNGIVVGHARGVLIEYCEAFNNGRDMPRRGNGPVGIWAWNADRVVIQFCVAYDNKSPGYDGGGFDLDGGVTNSILQYNVSYNNEGPGYLLCQYRQAPIWKNNVVRYNISVNDATNNNAGCGIEFHGGDWGISDCEVYNNTVYNEHGGAVAFTGLPVPGVRFRNNIFVSGGEIIRGDASHARFEGNLHWSLTGDRSLAGHDSLEAWAEATGQEVLEGRLVGLFADPLLTGAGELPEVRPEALSSLEAYRLRPGSPCLGAGVPVEGHGGRDLWGAEVPAGEPPSIGACQLPVN